MNNQKYPPECGFEVIKDICCSEEDLGKSKLEINPKNKKICSLCQKETY